MNTSAGSSSPTVVVVLGAGYAGLTAARRLGRRLRGSNAEVVLVSARDHFVERIRLHQSVTGQELATRPLARSVAGRGVRLCIGRVLRLDPGRRIVTVAVADGPPVELGYDLLIDALGSDAGEAAVPGGHLAMSCSGTDAAERLAAALARGPRSVVVVGAGLTGIECAAEVADAMPGVAVSLVGDQQPGWWLSRPGSRRIAAGLARLGVVVHRGRVRAVAPRGVWLGDGRFVDGEVVVWAAGFTVSPVARAAGLAVDPQGRVLVDRHLRSISHPEVYAVGDAAAAEVTGGTARMSCQTGLPMGAQAADIVAARLSGRPARRVFVRYVWQNISLGRRAGVTQFTRADDSPVPVVLSGRTSAAFKEVICRFAAWAAAGPSRQDASARGWSR